MARARVTHSNNSCMIIFKGDKTNRLEPETGVIQFPGGSVEVSRTDKGEYWAHIAINAPERCHEDGPKVGRIVGSRIDFDHQGPRDIPDIPDGEHVQHIAVRIATS